MTILNDINLSKPRAITPTCRITRGPRLAVFSYAATLLSNLFRGMGARRPSIIGEFLSVDGGRSWRAREMSSRSSSSTTIRCSQHWPVQDPAAEISIFFHTTNGLVRSSDSRRRTALTPHFTVNPDSLTSVDPNLNVPYPPCSTGITGIVSTALVIFVRRCRLCPPLNPP